MTPRLPPIGCNGRGAQASSLAAPVSLVEASIDEQFRLVKEAGVFDFFDRLPLPQQLDDYLRCIAQYDLPVATASWFYELGNDEALLPRNLDIAAAVGAKQHNIMVYAHDADGRLVSNEEIVDFYLRAYDLGMPRGVEPTLELHVNMWSEDPRRVSPVARAVQQRGIPFNFTLDYSHAIFKMGNPQELAACGILDDVTSGRLVLDPFAPGNLVDKWLAMDIVRWLQIRSVAPNGPRNIRARYDPENRAAAVPRHCVFHFEAGDPGRGILYPFTEPAPGEWHSPWRSAALEPAREVVRKVLRHHHGHSASRLRCITTEMINLPDYALGAGFSLIGQNAALAQFARDTWQALSAPAP
jgi:hypothetical protein